MNVMGNSAVILGILGTLIGGVFILHNLEDVADLPPALGIAIITLLYGLVIKVWCYPAARKIESRMGPSRQGVA